MANLDTLGKECYKAMVEVSNHLTNFRRGYLVEDELARLHYNVACAAWDNIAPDREGLEQGLVCTVIRALALCEHLDIDVAKKAEEIMREGAGYWGDPSQ